MGAIFIRVHDATTSGVLRVNVDHIVVYGPPTESVEYPYGTKTVLETATSDETFMALLETPEQIDALIIESRINAAYRDRQIVAAAQELLSQPAGSYSFVSPVVTKLGE